jgi:uncharacterized protein YprB with RNaseH-like and TPR domain/predicted nuclease with RNAse H fold/adenylate kinase family enzyme
MIQNTFLHIPGVGKKMERRIWQAGFQTWDHLWNALSAGRPVQELLSKSRQKELFAPSEGVPSGTRATHWLDCLDQSRTCLRSKDYGYFLELLRPSDHWRLLASTFPEALYLDIETTGLSFDLHYITVVGALYEGKFFQWTWPEPLDELAELVKAAPLVVTFNGKRFDVPFLQAKAPVIPAPKAHIDLLYSVRALGIKGGQKPAEVALGLRRDEDIMEVDGLEAVACWCSGLYGDSRSYNRLLRYNRADVEMMPELGRRVCEKLRLATELMPKCALPEKVASSRRGRRAAPFEALQSAWRERRPSLHLLQPKLVARFGREPVIVGIDLRAKSHNPTGWAVCDGMRTETCILYEDAEILERTRAAKPDLVSIDAPLSLPRGRKSVSDDSPCRKEGGIVRDAERILWSRGIRVYPALIRQMQGLTKRGIELTKILEAEGIPVIESYPGAAQDILNIPRKRLDETLLLRGLRQFGYEIHGEKSHDELDAITSALVGHFYLADQYEAIGADDEGDMIIPRSTMAWPSGSSTARMRRRTAVLVGLPGAGKTTLSRALAQRLGWQCFVLGDALREHAAKDTALRQSLAQGDLAPELLVQELVSNAVSHGDQPGLLVDGFPRHTEQLPLAQELFGDWTLIHLDLPASVAAARLQARLVCSCCGLAKPATAGDDQLCPNCGGSQWETRLEDDAKSIRRRLSNSQRHLDQLVGAVRGPRVISLDATRPVSEIAAAAVQRLMCTRLSSSTR